MHSTKSIFTASLADTSKSKPPKAKRSYSESAVEQDRPKSLIHPLTIHTEKLQTPRASSSHSDTQNSSFATGHGSPSRSINVSTAGFKTPSRPAYSPGIKRPASASEASKVARSEPPAKKQRRSDRPSRSPFSRGTLSIPSYDQLAPASPLFFSNSPQVRPQLPPRFSSSEAAAKMLSKANGEETGVKTVTLARGTYTTNSPPTANRPSHSRNRKSYSLSRTETPDSGTPLESATPLEHIGITEVLEHDERPTFVLDLQDGSNFSSDSLHLVFANAVLRSRPRLLARVTGHRDPSSSGSIHSPGFSQFKLWLLGPARTGKATDSLTTMSVHDNVVWSYSTIRRRIRVVRGNYPEYASGSTSSLISPLGAMPVLDQEHSREISTSSASNSEPMEPQDYFGNATAHSVAQSAQPVVKEEIMPSIEESGFSEEATPKRINSDQARRSTPSRKGDSHQAPIDYYPSDAVLSAACAGNIDTLLTTGEKEIGFFDWTRLPDSDALPKHIRFARNVNWAATPLGPIETWSADLRQMCNLIMASPHPAAMYWGEGLVAIYNEAYVLLAGQKHPKLMGQKYSDAWAEIWDEVKDVFASAQTTGQATMKDDDCLFIKRHDSLEETYFSWSIIPMVGGDGTVMGLYNPAFEKTRRKIAERRMLTLREVGERTAAAREVKGFWEEVIAALEFNEYDTPFVLLYSLHGDTDSDESSINSGSIIGTKQLFLEGSLAVPKGHEAGPEVTDMNSPDGFVPIFREVMKTNKPRLLDSTEKEIDPRLLQGLEERGFKDPPTSVVVCPIHPQTGDSTLGFLVMGVNPRRPYDEDYALFVQLLSRQLATSLASVVLFEEEIKRGQKAAKLAAMDKLVLSEALAARTQEAIESETKFTRMAEFAPVGMFIANAAGTITFCNEAWYDVSRVPKDSKSTDRWINFVKEEDEPEVKKVWQDLIERAKPATAEFRFKAPWMDRNGVSGDTWVIFSAYPEKYEDGTLKSVFGSITNISQQKWAEGLQKRKMEEAVELKRQQENFIDITSHEMRNPLSAILQCADELINTNHEARRRNEEEGSAIERKTLDDSIDAAQTISLCAQHQKRIVDDVLTLSKLDSALLMVTPVDAQPLAVVQKALKMFESELQTADIELGFHVDQSFSSLNVDWVKFDPSRVLQVLINLTTNAIKFTTAEKRRTITVTIAASSEPPQANDRTVVDYVPSRLQANDVTSGPDWGNGQELFIHFAVKDTGRGLSEQEKKLLFLRFSQASPRTHVQYGGSGLGLFISRQLVDLQGGSIGVMSTAGEGSTFAFYVKARRSSAPHADVVASGVGQKMQGTKGALRRSSDVKKKDSAPVHTSTTGQKKAELGPLHVLIVEDNLVNQKVLQKQLRNMGCITQVANHGVEALDKLKESLWWAGHVAKATRIDIVLMDQEMPVMDGLTCTRKVREMERQGKLVSHVPVIAVTANARNEQIKTAMEAGMDDVVSKPFRLPELVPKMEELSLRYRLV